MERVTVIRVLIIDDDALLTTSLAATLNDNTFEVYVANSGPEGIRLARETQPDVIVLDLMMPGMNGWEVCRELRSFSQAPILVLSAVMDSNLVMQILNAGATDYLIKPAPLGVLISWLRQLGSPSNSAQ